ncbi:bifunctional nuclease family protein, partial [Candidatus Zixiibacteriota bacterium]
MQEMYVSALAWDTSTNSPVVILAEVGDGDSRLLPIWIGHAEAAAMPPPVSYRPARRPPPRNL